jgi:hypothetical protein
MHKSSARQMFAGAALLGLCLLVAACQNGGDFSVLGYTTKPMYDPTVRTVRVPIFVNRTMIRGIEFQLTEEVIKQIELKTPWKVVQSEDADLELTGIVTGMPKRVTLQNNLNEVREAEVTLNVAVYLRDLRCGHAPVNLNSVPFGGAVPRLGPTQMGPGANGISGATPADVPRPTASPAQLANALPADQPNPNDPLAPLPPPIPPPLPPQFVQRSVSFIPELGESYESAKTRAVFNMAEQIVSMLEVSW